MADRKSIRSGVGARTRSKRPSQRLKRDDVEDGNARNKGLSIDTRPPDRLMRDLTGVAARCVFRTIVTADSG